MNLKRGLFRFWVIFAIIFAVVSFSIFLPGVIVGFAKAGTITALKFPDGIVVDGIPSDISPNELRRKFIERKDPSEKQLSNEQQAAITNARERMMAGFDLEGELAKAPRAPSPWPKLFEMLFIAIGIPLIVLTLGRAVIWAASGFKNE